MTRVLVTGGTGFIGSHTCVLLLEKGYDLIILDSFLNSSNEVVEEIKNLGISDGKFQEKRILIRKGDIRDKYFLEKIFKEALENKDPIRAVIHLAGLKSVSESVNYPFKYWEVNVQGSINLFKVMANFNCKTIVFSSSATIYGESKNKLINEDSEIQPKNTYGETKAAIEKILNTLYKSDIQNWRIINLRYFNPIGAHESGLLGEKPQGIPSNLFPFLTQVAIGERKSLNIFGNDWPTIDGTGVRDYIHIMDLAEGHLSALEYLLSNGGNFISLNLGTAKGTSVLQLIKTFEKVNKCSISFEFKEKRPGDIARAVADNKLAISLLKWFPKKNLEEMCKDGWLWQKNLNQNQA